MRIVVGADHGGFILKRSIVAALAEHGHDVVDVGTHSSDPVDYPDIAASVADAMATDACERGVLVCGSGVGASIAANKHRGLRAGLCHDSYSARQGVEHDAMNVLVLGGRVIGVALARELVIAFINASYTGEPRHERRLAKIHALEVLCR